MAVVRISYVLASHDFGDMRAPMSDSPILHIPEFSYDMAARSVSYRNMELTSL